MGLRQAGVDLAVFMPQMGRMTAGVHQAVTANAARIKAEGTDRWADLLKTTMLGGLVRDAILASPACVGFCGGRSVALSPRTVLSCAFGLVAVFASCVSACAEVLALA
ncbi:hypothetical protein ACFQ7B_20380 [Streptomyces erythrochromogenes]|uniref:hypothetical protein n=1 Tax=Streptomyces erythrochromogenes TaxID=285574 RepID=UPI0036AF6A8A